MTPSTPRKRASSGGGLSPQVVAMSVLVVIIAAVATIFYYMQSEKPAPEVDEPVVENPFEGLPPEEPPAPKSTDGK